MQVIPIQATPSQSLSVVLDGQNVKIQIYYKDQGIFVDVTSDNIAVGIGTLALNVVPLVSRAYSGFLGNLMFLDLQGNLDPSYSGFGTRYKLIYLTADEYALI